MATDAAPEAKIEPDALARHLTGVLGAPVQVLGLRPLGAPGDEMADPKGFGYGVPLEVECTVAGEPRRLVLARTRPTPGFGHDYPADRAWQALFAHPAYNAFPRHVRSLDVGFVRRSGQLVSAADAVDFFQIVEKAEGRPYWRDLERLLEQPLEVEDLDRAAALARFLAEVHRDKRDDPVLWVRRLRELVGHGECLMGILDSYPHPYPLLPPEVCEEVEQAAVGWRWRLRARAHRLSRVHGDFHPWNLLFRDGADFSALDRSRGEWGEPADDVAALAINYVFFGLRARAAGGNPGPFWALLRVFMDTYVRSSKDGELCEVIPPFLAFRALVLAHPGWYPALASPTRAALIRFARGLMRDPRFDPGDVEALFQGAA